MKSPTFIYRIYICKSESGSKIVAEQQKFQVYGFFENWPSKIVGPLSANKKIPVPKDGGDEYFEPHPL